jgi:DNA polymerase I
MLDNLENDPMIWVGLIDGQLFVRRNDGLSHISINEYIPDTSDYEMIYNHEGIDPTDTDSIVPGDKTNRNVLRLSAILGLNVNGSATVGPMKRPVGNTIGCILSYDIEVNTSKYSTGGFPMPEAPIISIASLCSCGDEFFAHTSVPSVDESTRISKEFFDYTYNHRPKWMIGWNIYAFDNQSLLFYTSDLESYSNIVRTSVSSSFTYGVQFNIPGVYNVDLYTYLLRTQVGRFTSMSLATVSSELGVGVKLDMPDMSTIPDYDTLRKYNLNDCKLVLDIWCKLMIDTEIINLSLCSASPVYDVCRYITGTMMCCMISSYALSHNKIVCWNPSDEYHDYKGGMVFDPVKGKHDNVAICDYNSMYPSIMIGCNISFETVEHVSSDYIPPDKREIYWDDTYVYIPLEYTLARYNYRGTNTIKSILIELIQERTRIRKVDPMYGTSLKVCANSIYGALGYTNSMIYSPTSSSGVTAIGRFCLQKARNMFESNSLRIVGGDTDSCFVKLDSDNSISLEDAVKTSLSELHKFFSTTPMSNMKMDIEEIMSVLIYVEKKHYCKYFDDGTIVFKGLSPARRSNMNLKKVLCHQICLYVCTIHDKNELISNIVRLIETVVQYISSGNVYTYDVCGLVNVNGTKQFTYYNNAGTTSTRSSDMGDTVLNDIDISHYCKVLREEVNRIVSVCELGTLTDILHKGSTI